MLSDKDKLEMMLALGPATFTFTKKDGSIRTMRATTSFAMIPREHHPQGLRKSKKADLYKVYDLDASSWRSFYWSSLVSVL